LLEPGANVRPEDIPFIGDTGGEPEPEAAVEDALSDQGYYAARERLLSKFDRRFLTQVVIRAGGNLSKAARMARVDRTTFYRLMERYGLHRDSLATPPE
jgi:DNA-binding NtrC family response regulator